MQLGLNWLTRPLRNLINANAYNGEEERMRERQSEMELHTTTD